MTVQEAEAFVANMADLGDKVVAKSPDAEEYVGSVMSRAQSMLDRSVLAGKVSEGIEGSLQRMRAGMEKWLMPRPMNSKGSKPGRYYR